MSRLRTPVYDHRNVERDDSFERDGEVEAFDRKKLIAGIDKACEKRPVSREAIRATVKRM